MKRKLLKQMRNEWRDNLWLVLALTIVTIVVWILFLQMWREVSGILKPLGFEIEDVYTLKVELVSEDSPEYVDYGEAEDEQNANVNRDRVALMRRLRESPNVLAASWSQNCIPYDLSWWGRSFFLADGTVDTIGYGGNTRWASPDISHVLRLKSHTGKSNDELAAMLRRGEILISDTEGGSDHKPEDIVGKKVFGNDSADIRKVGDYIQYVKRTDYERSWGGTVIFPIDDSNPDGMWDIIFRVKPGRGAAFIEEFDNTPAMQQSRNVYLAKLTKLSDKRKAKLHNADASVRMSLGIMFTFLLVIFLGLLGTFWFRVQQRIKEIAIRKVNGATRRQVFSRIIGESMILLAFATAFATIVAIVLVKYSAVELLSYWRSDLTPMYVFALISVALVAIGIIVSVWYPAWRAMRIEPAIAIKED